MRIVTWNCTGALRRKWPQLQELGANLAVVQECEDPAQAKDAAYERWAAGHSWVGPTKTRALACFRDPGLGSPLSN